MPMFLQDIRVPHRVRIAPAHRQIFVAVRGRGPPCRGFVAMAGRGPGADLCVDRVWRVIGGPGRCQGFGREKFRVVT